MERAPFFLPMRDCPNRCVYCDQRAITGHAGSPEPRDVREALRGITEPTEVCFFGGSFTCQPLGRQRDYLELFPWDFIDTGVYKDYLVQEDQMADAAIPTADCRQAGCLDCGICIDFGVSLDVKEGKADATAG